MINLLLQLKILSSFVEKCIYLLAATRKLPIGIQNFADLRDNNYIYMDFGFSTSKFVKALRADDTELMLKQVQAFFAAIFSGNEKKYDK